MPFDNLPLKPALRVLLDAARVLEERGWCQGDRKDDEPCVCAIEAISIAAGKRRSLCYAAMDRLKEHLGVKDVLLWQETPGRTADEVITAMRAAAGGA